MAEELIELTAAIQHELELARSGDGYEEAAVAGEIVERIVAPMFAAHDRRVSDLQVEFGKHAESWERQRKRLDADRALLRWLHAEAAWKATSYEAQMADAETEFGSAMDEADRVEEENNALRREVSRWRREVEFEANGADTFSGADAVAGSLSVFPEEKP